MTAWLTKISDLAQCTTSSQCRPVDGWRCTRRTGDQEKHGTERGTFVHHEPGLASGESARVVRGEN